MLSMMRVVWAKVLMFSISYGMLRNEYDIPKDEPNDGSRMCPRLRLLVRVDIDFWSCRMERGKTEGKWRLRSCFLLGVMMTSGLTFVFFRL
jgi:hypothetical protein